MKIGILTYHCQPNFGAQLQTISSLGWFKKRGFTPIVLNWYPKDLEDMYSKRVSLEQIRIHNKFMNAYMPITNRCRTEEQLIDTIEQEKVDAIFMGSDALFKYIPLADRSYFSLKHFKYIHPEVLSCERLLGNPFFGDFLSKIPNIPAVAFSVSSQNCLFTHMGVKEKKLMSNMLTNIKRISVRDEWTQQMVQYVSDRTDIKVTPDPVFSFNQNNYIRIPSKQEVISKYGLKDNYILLSFGKKYMPISYLRSLISEIEKHDFQPVLLPMPEGNPNVEIDCRIPLPLSPIEWYALIINSSGYIGERMHPIIVCLHNAIPFVVFDEYGIVERKVGGLVKKNILESSKTYSIVNRAGLDKYLVSYWHGALKMNPQQIISRLLGFDKDKCMTFSINYQHYYEESMNNMLNSLLN